MIDPESTSYPVLGAATAAGVEYGLAQRFVEANRRYSQIMNAWHTGDGPQPMAAEIADAMYAVEDAFDAIAGETSPATAMALLERLNAAVAEQRIYWPWGLPWGFSMGDNPLPGRIEDDSPSVWDGKAFDPENPPPC